LVVTASATGATRVRFLIDVHHIGSRQTGNETIARNISRELAGLAPAGELTFAACLAGAAEVAALTGQQPVIVSDSAIRRVAVDVPRSARGCDADAVLAQYTKPHTRRPCVVMVHDLSVFDPRSKGWLSRGFRSRVRMSITHSAAAAAALVACSEFTRQGLIERFGLDPQRVVLALSAVDPALADLLDAASPSPRDTGRRRVIAVGNVLPRKNLSILGAAVADLRASGDDVELRIVGGIPAAGEPVAAGIRDALGTAVSFTGYVSNQQLAQEYADADVLAFPSLFEGFGIPALEAMYVGVPVVVSTAGSLPEVVGDAGLVVAPGDRDAWSAALRALLTDAELAATYRSLGRDRARATEWRTGAVAVLNALHDAAGSSRPTSSAEPGGPR
jgi:glycosyltransferase involved in cell wall biosynthesis